MALQRQNPLPPDIYWVDVTEKDFEPFESWLESNSLTVHVRTVEETPRKQVTPGASGPIGYAEYWPATRWYLFEVKAPTPWNGPGFPNIAGAVTSKDETVDQPEPMTPGDVLEEVTPDLSSPAGTLIKAGVFIAGMFGLGYLIRSVKR